ncbi:iron complex outermembrane receptor protein [Sphingomonas sp. SORGH_AS802]|uniref:TonB-dependent siderophore receptor n=1 Tax=unclassified Sphingomonas TaxID=196159 RepID=UPI00285D0356|nr:MULTISPECIES: TonB-dependent siderophore receptor [unclassified Sphingomonas]MDR6129030.1 iron complex outermembrane receptor protein [Sphingomonas sp. SORGH_AS_0438]MDR6136412.1 iron complex outermembrane receptor protein [Sphingomonas sp. SORGH_AS_0802]
MKPIILAGVALATLAGTPVRAAEPDAAERSTPAEIAADKDREILVEGRRDAVFAGTKTDTPLIEVPQPVTVIPDDVYLAQGAISVADTVRYAAGVNSDAYGRDTRVDSFTIRGVNALQFRDGMRDIFSYYASITADPYNFSRVEVVRGPASVLFGQGSIGGIVNLVSKTPLFTNSADLNLVYGSYDRKEVLADVNGVVGDKLAARIVARVRDADTYVDHVPDDRVMIAPSVTWRPGSATDVTLLGLYQDDHTGSTTNFLPVIGTLRDNPGNPRLPRYLFVGKPGYDRYDGRLLQGSGLVTHRFTDDLKLSLKARYIDSALDYFTHYPDSYSNPTDPYLPGSNGRRIGLYAGSSVARLDIFSTDNNVQWRVHTGPAVEHTLLAGVDYSWNQVRKSNNYGYQVVDLYDIDYASIVEPPLTAPFTRDAQKQLGLYVQDQMRLWDRVSVVLGARRDRVRGSSLNTRTNVTSHTTDTATTFRAGIIGEVGAGLSPFFSYTESFQPIAGQTTAGTPFRPQTGRQFETGVKWQADRATLVTLTGFDITERNRPIPDPANPLGQIQAGELTTKGFELEATRTLPGDYDLSLAYGFNDVDGDTGEIGYLSRHTASAWGTKTFRGDWATLRLGAGVRYLGQQVSGNDTWTLVTPARTMVDALVELERDRWRLRLNATNLLDNRAYASCLARGDCFVSAPRNVMLSLGYRL